MNKKQRFKNRRTARVLSFNNHNAMLAKHVCEECGEFGGHWFSGQPMTLEEIISGTTSNGFWTCDKFYGPDGRRINP